MLFIIWSDLCSENFLRGDNMPMIDFAQVTSFATQLEGPYRWYILGFVLIVLTALVTKFIFKTIKWFLVLSALALIGLAIFKILAKLLP